MKTLRKGKEKKALKGFKIINANNLQQIKGGEGAPITRDSVL
jgi:bacteriocin-like protein